MKKTGALIFSALSIAALYYYLKWHSFPAFTPSYLLFIPRPDPLKYLFFAAFVISAADIGAWLLSFSTKVSGYPATVRFVLSAGAGFASISAATLGLFALGSAGIKSLAALIALPFAARAIVLFARAGSGEAGTDSSYSARLFHNLPTLRLLGEIFRDALAALKASFASGARDAFCVTSLVAVLAFSAIFSTLPQTSWDALAYQMEIPKQYVAEGRLFFISDIHFWGHPQLVNMAYSIFITFGMDTLCSTFHSLFIIFTVCLILAFPLERSAGAFLTPFGRRAAALLYAAHPQVMMLSSYAYVDLALAFYFTAAVFLLAETECRAAASFAGCAMSVKYTGLVMAAALAVSSLVSVGGSLGEKAKRLLLISVISGLVFSPYMIKNYAFTANPFYPYLAGFVPGKKIEYKYLDLYQTMLDAVGTQSVGGQKSLLDMMSYPFSSAFNSRFYNNRYYDGVMGVTFLLLIPFFAAGLVRPQLSDDDEKKRAAGGFFVIFTAYYVFVLKAQSTRFFLPAAPLYFTVAAAGLSWYAGFVFGEGGKRLRSAAAVAGTLFALANGSPVLAEFAKKDPAAYLSGREDKKAYLSRTLDMWDCVDFYNGIAAASSERLYLILIYETRTYYVAGKYSWRDLFEPSAVETEVPLPDDDFDNFAHRSPGEIAASLKKLGATHILLGDAQKRVLLRNIGSAGRQAVFVNFLKEKTDILLAKRNYTLYRIKY